MLGDGKIGVNGGCSSRRGAPAGRLDRSGSASPGVVRGRDGCRRNPRRRGFLPVRAGRAGLVLFALAALVAAPIARPDCRCGIAEPETHATSGPAASTHGCCATADVPRGGSALDPGRSDCGGRCGARLAPSTFENPSAGLADSLAPNSIEAATFEVAWRRGDRRPRMATRRRAPPPERPALYLLTSTLLI